MVARQPIKVPDPTLTFEQSLDILGHWGSIYSVADAPSKPLEIDIDFSQQLFQPLADMRAQIEVFASTNQGDILRAADNFQKIIQAAFRGSNFSSDTVRRLTGVATRLTVDAMERSKYKPKSIHEGCAYLLNGHFWDDLCSDARGIPGFNNHFNSWKATAMNAFHLIAPESTVRLDSGLCDGNYFCTLPKKENPAYMIHYDRLGMLCLSTEGARVLANHEVFHAILSGDAVRHIQKWEPEWDWGSILGKINWCEDVRVTVAGVKVCNDPKLKPEHLYQAHSAFHVAYMRGMAPGDPHLLPEEAFYLAMRHGLGAKIPYNCSPEAEQWLLENREHIEALADRRTIPVAAHGRMSLDSKDARREECALNAAEHLYALVASQVKQEQKADQQGQQPSQQKGPQGQPGQQGNSPQQSPPQGQKSDDKSDGQGGGKSPDEKGQKADAQPKDGAGDKAQGGQPSDKPGKPGEAEGGTPAPIGEGQSEGQGKGQGGDDAKGQPGEAGKGESGGKDQGAEGAAGEPGSQPGGSEKSQGGAKGADGKDGAQGGQPGQGEAAGKDNAQPPAGQPAAGGGGGQGSTGGTGEAQAPQGGSKGQEQAAGKPDEAGKPKTAAPSPDGKPDAPRRQWGAPPEKKEGGDPSAMQDAAEGQKRYHDQKAKGGKDAPPPPPADNPIPEMEKEKLVFQKAYVTAPMATLFQEHDKTIQHLTKLYRETMRNERAQVPKREARISGHHLNMPGYIRHAHVDKDYEKIFHRKPIELAESEYTIHLVLDSSGSMYGGSEATIKPATVMMAINMLALLDAGHRASLSAFAQHGEVLIPPCSKTSEAIPLLSTVLSRAMDNDVIHQGARMGSGTEVYYSIRAPLEAMSLSKEIVGPQCVMVFSDGGVSNQHSSMTEKLLRDCKQAKIPILYGCYPSVPESIEAVAGKAACFDLPDLSLDSCKKVHGKLLETMKQNKLLVDVSEAKHIIRQAKQIKYSPELQAVPIPSWKGR